MRNAKYEWMIIQGWWGGGGGMGGKAQVDMGEIDGEQLP